MKKYLDEAVEIFCNGQLELRKVWLVPLIFSSVKSFVFKA